MKAAKILTRLRRFWHSLSMRQWGVLLLLMAIAVVSSLVAVLSGDQTWGGLLLNFSTELAGAIVIYIMLRMVVGTRGRKEDLIAQMGSDVRGVAITAIEELRHHGWLTDGSLRGADFHGANLQRADLRRANLMGANLMLANFQKADLRRADLMGADLMLANLQEAILLQANLQETNLQLANLQGAVLVRAKFQGAQLQRAVLHRANLGAAQDLETAKLDGAKANSETQWPDGFSPLEAGVIVED